MPRLICVFPVHTHMLFCCFYHAPAQMELFDINLRMRESGSQRRLKNVQFIEIVCTNEIHVCAITDNEVLWFTVAARNAIKLSKMVSYNIISFPCCIVMIRNCVVMAIE